MDGLALLEQRVAQRQAQALAKQEELTLCDARIAEAEAARRAAQREQQAWWRRLKPVPARPDGRPPTVCSGCENRVRIFYDGVHPDDGAPPLCPDCAMVSQRYSAA